MNLLLSRRLATWLLVLSGVLILVLVFEPFPFLAHGSINYGHRVLMKLGFPRWITGDVVEFTWNVLMFVPLTYLGSVLLPRVVWWKWVLAGLLASCTIELVQLIWLPDRSATVSDVISNTLGALIGALAVQFLRERIRRKEHEGERIG